MRSEISIGNAHFNVASRGRRRTLVVLIYAGFAVAEIAWFMQSHIVTPAAMLLGIMCLTALTALAGSTYEKGDEREEHRRDHVYFLAHQPLGWILVAALFAAGLRGIIPLLMQVSLLMRAFLDQLPYAVLVAGGILFATLPQAILLWTEPDMEEPK